MTSDIVTTLGIRPGSDRARAGRRRWFASKAGQDALFGGLLVLPVVIVLGALVLVPLALTAGQSLFRVDPMRPGMPFIGAANYVRLFGDAEVRAAGCNTLWLVALAVTLETAGGMAVALLLQSMRTGRRWMLAVVMLPWAMPPVVNSLMWASMFNPSYGLVNYMLQALQVFPKGFIWSNSRPVALMLIALVHVWKMLPPTAIIMLAALQSIPKHLYEAAKMDGASPIRMFVFITLPVTAVPLAIAMTQSTVTAFNLFDEAWILGGASFDTRTLLIQVYMSAFQSMHLSYGMALSILVMLASLALSAVFILRNGEEVTHD